MQALYLDTALYLSRINELSTTKKKPVLQSDGEGEEEEVKVKEFIYFFTMIMILYPEQGCIFQTNFIILIIKMVNFPENSFFFPNSANKAINIPNFWGKIYFQKRGG